MLRNVFPATRLEGSRMRACVERSLMGSTVPTAKRSRHGNSRVGNIREERRTQNRAKDGRASACARNRHEKPVQKSPEQPGRKWPPAAKTTARSRSNDA